MVPPLVDAAWLSAHLDDPRVVVADVRWYLDGRSGRAAFDAGHVPGAVFVDLDADLSHKGAPTEGRHPLPTPEAFAAALGRLGIGPDATVVAYDDSGGGSAARLVWMMRAVGQEAALLDGGLAAWAGPLEPGPGGARPVVAVPVRPWPTERLAAVEEVAAPRPGTVVLDARAPERFRGDVEPVDPRAGHIPGARNLPWASLLDPATGRFLDREALRSALEVAGAGPGDVVASCGSGVSACAVLVAREAAGYGPGRLFVASFSGWSSDPARAVATGSDG